jgi:hypothetical protein
MARRADRDGVAEHSGYFNHAAAGTDPEIHRGIPKSMGQV